MNNMKDVRPCRNIMNKTPQLGSGSPREQEWLGRLGRRLPVEPGGPCTQGDGGVQASSG